MNLFLFSLISLCSLNHIELYSNPKPDILYKQLSESLRKDVRENFIILQTIKYEFSRMKVTLDNNSIIKKNKFLEKKNNNRRKVDRMFSRYKKMITDIHIKTKNNLFSLEGIRKRVSDELYDLKINHQSMIERLIEKQKYVDHIYEDKKKKHMETTEEKYKDWKNKREEIIDIIEGL